ncbi:hypothetical protein [Aquamicrobium soli]|uniref:Uncharacterized protein n=1 Tax=Aquamicrobium soli TaxID=1811518 RepID=A0ABV7K6Y2_9HYPH
MALSFGSLTVAAVYYGSLPVQKIYAGSREVWSAGGASSYTLPAGAGAFTLAGQDALLKRALVLKTATGTIALAGNDANLTVVANGEMIAGTGNFVVTGADANLLRSLLILASPGSFSFTGNDAAFRLGKMMAGGAGSFALNGQAATFLRSLRLGASAGSFALAGKAATLTYSPVAASAKVGFANFQIPTVTGNFTISCPDLGGLTPKMVVFFLSNAEVSETGHTAAGEDGFHMAGASDGVTHAAAFNSSVGAQNNGRRGYSIGACMLEINALATTQLEAAFVSFGTGQVTVNITTLTTELQSKRGFAMFFAGADCDAAVGIINGETDGTTTSTLPFTPDAVIFTEASIAAPGSASNANQSTGFVINDGGPTQFDVGRMLISGSGNGRANDKAVGAFRTSSSAANTASASFSGPDLSLAWSVAEERDVLYAAWRFNGSLTTKAGSISSPTSAGRVSASGLGITPQSVFFLLGAGAINTTVTGGGYGTGWLTATGGGSCGCLSKIGYCSTTRLNIENGADIGEFSAFASGSFEVNFVTADATARVLPFIAFGT